MINVQELRIGNYVDCERPRYYEKFITVESVCFDSINLNFREYELEKLQPIPLTEEWLLKLGFIKSKLEGYDVHFKYSHHLLHSSITALYNAEFSLLLDNVARGIKYVHQLQNLYFALTGEELTIKE
jgi:hypothetical protein